MAVADFIAEQAEIQLIRAADWTKTLSELVDEKRRTISSPEPVMTLEIEKQVLKVKLKCL